MRNRRLLGAGLAAAAALALGAAPASAETLVPSGTLTEPGGVVRTPDGKLWVVDALQGVCEVQGNLLIPSPFCQPHVDPPPGEEDPPTATAPEASDLAYDAESDTLWATEGTSGSSGVWKLTRNALTGQIAAAEKVADTTAGDDRAFGLDLTRVEVAPGVTELEVDFVTKRSGAVQRVSDATGTPSVSTVGFIQGEGADVARLDGKLYVAEETGITVIDPAAIDPTAVPVPELAGQLGGALIDDEDRGRLYVGTASGIADEVLAFEPSSGRVEGIGGGMAGVSALNLDTEVGHLGDVLAADDPAVASEAVGAEGGGRVLRFANIQLGLPRVAIDTAPPVVSTVTTADFTFHATESGGALECALDGGAWEPCDSGAKSWGPLADGSHEAAFRALTSGVVTRHVFVIDTGAPAITIDNPESDRTVTGDALDLRFTADEGGVTFDCAVDGRAPAPCSSPLRLRRLSLGDHQVVVTGTDIVGQVSGAATWTFRTVPVPPKPEPPKVDNSGPGNAEDRPRTPDIIRPFTTGDSSVSCRSAVTTRLNLRRPPAVVRIAFPGGFKPRYVRMTVTKQGKKSNKAVRVIGTHRVLETSRPCTSVSWGLWRNEARRLRTGTYRLTVLAGKDRRSARRVWSGKLRVTR
jgi:hypothetical protein